MICHLVKENQPQTDSSDRHSEPFEALFGMRLLTEYLGFVECILGDLRHYTIAET